MGEEMLGNSERKIIRQIMAAVEEELFSKGEFPPQIKKRLRRQIITAVTDYSRASLIGFLSNAIVSEEFAIFFGAMNSERG